MYPHFISSGLDTFQMCAHPGCDSDAVDERTVDIAEGTQLFLASCREHQKELDSVAEVLRAKPRITKVIKDRLNMAEVFISPKAFSDKCRYVQWEEYTNPKVVKPEEVTIVKHSKDSRVHAKVNWSWPLNRYQWRDVEGRVLPLKRIRLAELISAVQQIVQENYSITPRKMQWINRLGTPQILYIYPPSALRLDSNEIREKMMDFLVEAQGRGLL